MAVQLAFLDGGVTHAYQVGINPDLLADSPGWIVHTQSIKRAIALGQTNFDFLRGDEPHKQRMGAQPRAMMTARVVSPRFGPTMVHKAWVTGTTVKNWIKAGLEKTGMR
jgi:CelD/BcsL family acetyltransferase involved in cellulose biosynthesis